MAFGPGSGTAGKMASALDKSEDVPSPSEVRTEVERMAASEIFRSSPQLAAFLRFVVEAVLGGQSGRIKGYTIGVEVLLTTTQ